MSNSVRRCRRWIRAMPLAHLVSAALYVCRASSRADRPIVWAGNCENRLNAVGIHVLYDHQEYRAEEYQRMAVNPKALRSRLVYVKPTGEFYTGPPVKTPSDPVGTFGTYDNPFMGVDNAIPQINNWDTVSTTSWRHYLVLLPRGEDDPSTASHFTGGISNLASSGSDYEKWGFVGGGDNPASVTLRLRSTSSATAVFDFSATTVHDLIISNMTICGPKAISGVKVASARRCILANLVIHDMKGDAIRIESVFGVTWDDPAFWHAEGVYIENNTIVNCQRGITVERVPKSQNAQEGFRSDGKLELHPSRVENNIVVFGHALGEGAAHGIRIGSSSGDADQQCLAWNPFTNPFGDDPEQTGNPWVPVKYNWVWREGSDVDAFTGTTWYSYYYRVSQEIDHQELFADPQLGGDYHLQTNSPAIRAGNPYRIDAVKKSGKWYGMRRSLGAFKSDTLSDYDILLENQTQEVIF